MPEYTTAGYKLVLKYATGSYSFSDIDLSATPEQIYNLAKAINAFQTEPATIITCVTSKEVM